MKKINEIKSIRHRSIALQVILSLFFVALFIGCDGYRHIRMKFDRNIKSEDINKTIDKDTLFQELSAYLNEFSNKNKFKCIDREGGIVSLLCGGRSITIELSKRIQDGEIELRISQFGPLGATKEYEKVRDELLNFVPKHFPSAYVNEVKGIQ